MCHITNHSNHTCAYTVTINPQWMPLCASASWNDESHSVLLHWLSDRGGGGEKQSVTLCLLSTASANRHRRTPISPRSELTLPRSPLTHLLLSGCTCWSSTPALICTREPTLTPVFFPKYVTACALEQQSNFHQYENVKGCCSCTPTHTHTQTHN